MTRHRTLLVVVAALLVVLAGCSSIGSQVSPTETETSTGETPTETSTDATPTETSTDATPTDAGPTPDVERLRSQVIEALDGVEQYRAQVNESRTVVGNLRRELSIEQEVAIDRATGNLHIDATQSTTARSLNVDNYLVNDTMYQRSPAYVEQFSTEWVVIDTVENLTRIRQTLDPLVRQQRILEVGEVAYNGTGTIDGTEVYRLETAPEPERLEELFVEQVTGPGSQVNESSYSISNVSFTFWVASETNRPVTVKGRMDSSISSQGRTTSIRQSFAFEYDYEASVSIELPDEAEGAVKLSEALNETTGT